MEACFTLKLIMHGADEAILIVWLDSANGGHEYFVDVFSFNRMQIIAKKIKDENRKYFYKRNLLVVYELTQNCLNEVVKELEETGDFFEIMKPLNWRSKAGIYWIFLAKKILNYVSQFFR